MPSRGHASAVRPRAITDVLPNHEQDAQRKQVADPVHFELLQTDSVTMARRGRVTTRHGVIETPAFMPVGTQATVKTLHPDEVRATGAQIILANTYHLMLRPGLEVIEAAGQLHRFMGWSGPILTDSGGFQIFSLAQQAKVREEGVSFRSHIDGSKHLLSPERAVELQIRFGSDIVMPLDHLVGLPSERKRVAEATARTARWLDRCIEEHRRLDGDARGSALFGICQGGMEPDLRRESAAVIAAAGVSGSAIGGLSVGEPKDVMAAMVETVTPMLPTNRPRYLMGVGSPEDLWSSVARGVDLFDCVLPTRLARNGALFTADGRIDIVTKHFRDLHEPVDAACDCSTCSTFTAAYIHHLFRAREILGLRLASVHNLRFLARQMESIRQSIVDGTFGQAHRAFIDRYRLPPSRGVAIM
jgi:queuine tRNA-ribosyltransferase